MVHAGLADYHAVDEPLFVRLERPNRDTGAVGYTGGDNNGVLRREFLILAMAAAVVNIFLVVGFGMVIGGPESKFNRLKREFAPAGLGIDLGMSVFGGYPIGVAIDKPVELAIFLYLKLISLWVGLTGFSRSTRQSSVQGDEDFL